MSNAQIDETVNIDLLDDITNIDTITENENIVENVTVQDEQTLEENQIDSTDNTVETNCLALTVKKDYTSVILKNIFTASGRVSLKVLLSTILINLLDLFF